MLIISSARNLLGYGHFFTLTYMWLKLSFKIFRSEKVCSEIGGKKFSRVSFQLPIVPLGDLFFLHLSNWKQYTYTYVRMSRLTCIAKYLLSTIDTVFGGTTFPVSRLVSAAPDREHLFSPSPLGNDLCFLSFPSSSSFFRALFHNTCREQPCHASACTFCKQGAGVVKKRETERQCHPQTFQRHTFSITNTDWGWEKESFKSK